MQVQKPEVPILMYHSISTPTHTKFRPYIVSPEAFAEQVAYLYHHAYTPLTVSQCVRILWEGKTALPERPVVITFDDGFADFYTAAFPILMQYRFAATIYISTAFVNGTWRWRRIKNEKTRPMLTWEQLAEISASPVECGAHTHSHPELDILPAPRARQEIAYSKWLLEDHLGREIQSFAYPFGLYTSRTKQLVREAGFTSACTTKPGCLHNDSFALRRLLIDADMPLDAFSTLLQGHHSSPGTVASRVYARACVVGRQVVRRYKAFLSPKQ